MKIDTPKHPPVLNEISDFFTLAQNTIEEEGVISTVSISNENLDTESFYRLEVEQTIVSNCIFTSCDFRRTSFYDVQFKNCDLSNSKFNDAYFNRCQFINCKCVGANMTDVIMKNITFETTNLTFSTFDGGKLSDVYIDQTDLTDVSMAEMTLQRFQSNKSRFIKNNFFKTKLKGIDFTDSELVAPTLSSPPIELKGATINMYQASDLIRLWGVKVK